MYRMGFREGQKYASINMVPGGGGDVICSRHPKGTRIPCTVNICPPVGAELVSVSTLNPVIFPYNTDKIGLAGALQGGPIELVKAKTVDAYAIAQSEWVLEGYVVEGQQVWETDEAERLGKQGVAPLHPEWARAMGHAYRTPRAFELTAITRRRDNPIVYTPHFGAFWYEAPFMCAAVYELCERIAPGFVIDVASWLGLTLWGGLVIQVKKTRRSHEGLQRNVLGAVMGVFRGLRLCVVVDDDIDPWQPEDVVYAIEFTRVAEARLHHLQRVWPRAGLPALGIQDRQYFRGRRRHGHRCNQAAGRRALRALSLSGGEDGFQPLVFGSRDPAAQADAGSLFPMARRKRAWLKSSRGERRLRRSLSVYFEWQ